MSTKKFRKESSYKDNDRRYDDGFKGGKSSKNMNAATRRSHESDALLTKRWIEKYENISEEDDLDYIPIY